MTRKPDPVTSEELPITARTRVRLPDQIGSTRIFPGWGPDLGR
jgi:hypothetical protein